MRQLILILCAFFAVLTCQAQTITKDSSYLKTSTVNDTTFFQQCRVLEYDNGQSSEACGALIDSLTLIKRLFRDAHQAIRPLARAFKTSAVEFEYRRAHNDLSDLLEEVTGETYFDRSKDRYGEEFKNLLIKVTDRSADPDSVFFAQINSNLRARQVNDAAINNSEKTYSFSGYKILGYSKLIRFYDVDHIRFLDLFGDTREFVLIGKQVNEDGVETGREVWRTPDNQYRLIIYRDLTEE